MTNTAEYAEYPANLAVSSRWVLAARLKTLGLSVTPVLAGTWLAAMSGVWRPGVLAAALVSAASIQIGTNLWNDAADAANGVDTKDRLGPPRMTALGLLDGGRVRQAAGGMFLLAALAGLFLVGVGGWPILLIGLASLALGYLYSMGPYPLSSTPVGELLVVAFFGVAAVAGTVWLHGAPLDGKVWMTGFCLGLPAASVLLVNNHRDRKSDQAGGRRTLAILIGEVPTKLVFAALNATALAGLYWTFGGCGVTAVLLAAPAVFGAYVAWRMWTLPASKDLNPVLAQTALFQFALLAALAGSAPYCS